MEGANRDGHLDLQREAYSRGPAIEDARSLNHFAQLDRLISLGKRRCRRWREAHEDQQSGRAVCGEAGLEMLAKDELVRKKMNDRPAAPRLLE